MATPSLLLSTSEQTTGGPKGPGTVSASTGAGGGATGGGGGGGSGDGSFSGRLDVLALPSAEWVLPSPITACAVCRGVEMGIAGGGRGGAGGGGGEGGGVVGGPPWGYAASAAMPPLVAIGTESGGVYLCDAALGTTREGLSRHRARVTSLAFQGRRYVHSLTDCQRISLVRGFAFRVGHPMDPLLKTLYGSFGFLQYHRKVRLSNFGRALVYVAVRKSQESARPNVQSYLTDRLAVPASNPKVVTPSSLSPFPKICKRETTTTRHKLQREALRPD